MVDSINKHLRLKISRNNQKLLSLNNSVSKIYSIENYISLLNMIVVNINIEGIFAWTDRISKCGS